MLDELYQLRESAKGALSRGNLQEAAQSLLSAASYTHVAETDYRSVLEPLADTFFRMGDVRSALSIQWYLALGSRNELARTLQTSQNAPPIDRARTFAAMGDYASAAREVENAGLVAAAAIYREKADDWAGARALWSRLGQVSQTGQDAYSGALVQFNLARTAKHCNDPRQAKSAIVAAVRLLEEAADHFESVGQRERAFDCFQVLVQIGREGGMFEDVLEGFVNCIRILREDHLKYFALQYFEDALSAAKERGELSAAATLAREAAEYARALGMSASAAHYTLLQADLWRGVATQHKERGSPAEIAENAVLAAILAFGEMGQYKRVGQLYEELAAMDLDEMRKTHYARASKRYAGVRDEPLESAPLPVHLRQDNHFPDVWHVDVLEWEQNGSAAEACADVLLDKRWPDLIRRKAMLARLTALFAEARPTDVSPPVTNARVRLAGELAQLQLYAVLSPLEALFARQEKQVKTAVLAAMQTLFFKRSFVTVRSALRESDPQILDQAARAIEALYFQHAFDPLSRIVREAPQAAIRASALKALARVDTLEAAEFLLGILEHGAPPDRSAAVEGLQRARGSRFVELVRQNGHSLAPEIQSIVREILRARGISV